MMCIKQMIWTFVIFALPHFPSEIYPGEEDFGCHHANTAGHADSGRL